MITAEGDKDWPISQGRMVNLGANQCTSDENVQVVADEEVKDPVHQIINIWHFLNVLELEAAIVAICPEAPDDLLILGLNGDEMSQLCRHW